MSLKEATILTNPTYLRKIVSGRRRVKSFKEKEILFDVSRRVKASAKMYRHLIHRLKQETSGMLRKQEQLAEKELAQMTARIDELEVIIGRLYEDSALGRITAVIFFGGFLDNGCR